MHAPGPGPRLRAAALLSLALLGALAAPSAAGAADPLRPQQWGLDAINARAAHAMATGEGITVAVIDTGVDAGHEDLSGRVARGPDLIDGDGVPADENGHGTHVAGIIGAIAGNGLGVEGAAPGARILAVRVLDAQSSGDSDLLARGIDAAVRAGAQVLNLSLSAGPEAPSLFLADSDLVRSIERAADAGTVVVAAAGNDSLPLCAQPIVQRRILCVGAIDERRERASFSNYGVRVDLVAPGGSILSTTPGNKYGLYSGTSQATPYVAAAAAVLLGQGLSARQAMDRLVGTARDLGLPGTDFVFGAGLLDLQAAVGAPDLVAADPGQASPQVARITVKTPTATSRAKIRTFLRRGIAVRCRVATAGPCTARLLDSRRRVLGTGRRTLPASRMGTVRVWPTRSARARLRKARLVRSMLRVQGPVGATVTKRLDLVR